MKAAAMSRRYAHVNHVTVVGAGQMGTGIALAAARDGGTNVHLIDDSELQLSKSRRFIDRFFDGEVRKGRYDGERAALYKAQISFRAMNDCRALLARSEFVIEAITENVGLKQSLFQKLSDATARDAILASNTSSISITKIAASTKHKQNVIGMHFMNPVPKMPLVEIVEGLTTSSQTTDATKALGRHVVSAFNANAGSAGKWGKISASVKTGLGLLQTVSLCRI